MLSTETLQETIEEAAQKVRSREDDVNAARALLVAAERELKLLAELAQIRGVELPEAALSLGATIDEPGPNGTAGHGSGRTPSRSRSALLTAVVEILEAQNEEPMQIQDLMAAVQKRQVRIPGKGQQANLIAYISRDPRIVRPRRGYYGLAEWGLKDTKPAPRPKRRRRRRQAGTK